MNEPKPPGILRGCLPIVLVVIFLIGGTFAFFAWRAGGIEGIKRDYIVKGSLNLVQQHALDSRPDGVSAVDVEATFDAMRLAVDDERVDLDRMYRVLRDYQEKFKGTKVKPSNDEMATFLETLRACALPRSD